MSDADLPGRHPSGPRPRAAAVWLAALLVVQAIATVLFSPAPHAQTPWLDLADPVFQSLGVEAGLPNPVSLVTVEDPSGFLWIGTTAGLARWDGYRFRVFGANAHAPDLPDNFVQALHIDAGGRLWVGTAAGGVVRYDPEADRFVPVALTGVTHGRVEIRDFADDGAGGLWIASAGGLYHLDRPDGTARLLPQSVAWKSVLSLLRDRSGALWVGTSRGLFRARGSDDFQPVKLPLGPVSVGSAVMSLAEDSAGRIWAGTFSSGVFVIDASRIGARHISDPAGNAGSGSPIHAVRVGSLDVEHIIEAQPGEIWLATPGQGIVVVNEATGATRSIQHDPAQQGSLAGDLVSHFYRDRNGTLWIATDHGLSALGAKSAAFSTIFSHAAPGPAGPSDRITDPNITSVLAASDGRVWLGLEKGGIDLVDPVAQTVEPLPAASALPHAAVAHLTEIPGAGVFIATRSGLLRADLQGRVVTQVAIGSGTIADPVPTLAASKSVLWLPRDGELSALHPVSPPALLSRPRSVLSLDRLLNPRVSIMLPDPPDRLWIGTWDGLASFDSATGAIEQVPPDPAVPDGLSAGFITSMLRDRLGRLWIGTVGGGIDILTGRKDGGRMSFRRLGLEDGLPDPSVDTMLMAQDGEIWASTDNGLAEIDPQTLRIRAYHSNDGVAIPSYWADSGAVTRAGDLVFGGAGGLTIVHLASLPAAPSHPRLVVTDLRIGGRSLPSARLNQTGTIAPVIVKPGAGALSIEFSALDYINPGQDQYGYKLEGMDRSWTVTDATRRLATYTNLPPGTYSLRLRATVDGATVQRSIPVQVVPAWYQTITAKFAFALFYVTALSGVIWASTMLLRRRQRELEQLVARRTAELRGSNAALRDAVETLGHLRTLGQEITASLNIDVVLTILHRSIARLITTQSFAVYLIGAEGGDAFWRFGTRNGRRLAAAPNELPHAGIVAQAIQERAEVVRPDLGVEASVLCAPLIVQDRVIGAITITSRRCAIFSDRERVVFRTLCGYGAIGISNAETLLRLADMHARLEQIAYSDSLTDLPNRRAFNEQLDDFIARGARRSGRFALLLIDLDDFKNVNDAYGHDIGDALLVETASRLRLIVRPADQVLRIGGDEFAVLLDSVDDLTAPRELCRSIAEQFASGMLIEGRRIASHVSIGVAMFPRDAATQERIYKAADIALYAAKRAGGGRAVFFEPALNAAALSNRQIKHDLAEAVHRQEFSVFYQPLYAARDRALVGFEALLRWLHPVRGWLGPAAFIGVAEETGLISALGRLVLAHAVATARDLKRAGKSCLVCVNLSVHHLAEGAVAGFVAELLQAAELGSHAICIEVTESTLMNEGALAEIHRLKALGLKISIDDFGTGYSSLAYLSALPVDTVKIDQRFVAPLGSDPAADRLFCAIVDLAHTLGLRTIAEGCETEAQYAIVRSSGCNDVQGWLFARAMDPDTLRTFLSSEIVTSL